MLILQASMCLLYGTSRSRFRSSTVPAAKQHVWHLFRKGGQLDSYMDTAYSSIIAGGEIWNSWEYNYSNFWKIRPNVIKAVPAGSGLTRWKRHEGGRVAWYDIFWEWFPKWTIPIEVIIIIARIILDTTYNSSVTSDRGFHHLQMLRSSHTLKVSRVGVSISLIRFLF